jgi:cell division protein ZapE
MSLSAAYRSAVERGELAPDPDQARAIQGLERVATDLASARGPGLFRKADSVKGAYLWGPVGRGKSLLMDLFFQAAPIAAKRRVHFHVFMAEVHSLVGLWRKGSPAERQARFGQSRGDDPIPPLAKVIAEDARLLCFDELHVTDIADAMILGRLFEALFERGVTLVATSNRAPDDLYKDGLNRQLFLPFIALLKQKLDVIAVAGARDYRLDRMRAGRTWFAPKDPDNERQFDVLWRDLLGGDAETGVTLEVFGRREHWPRAAGGLLRAHFASLCGHALGPSDYLAIAERFHTVFIEAVPVLTPDKRDQAKRFSTLIDALYEARTRIAVLAAAEPDALYRQGDGAFEFERAASRLMEMRSADWLDPDPKRDGWTQGET